MPNKVRLYTLTDLIAELKERVTEIRLEALNRPYTAAIDLGHGQVRHEPALQFFIDATAVDNTNIYYYTQIVGSTLATLSEQVKQLADKTEEIREEIAKQLADAGFTVKKGSFEV